MSKSGVRLPLLLGLSLFLVAGCTGQTITVRLLNGKNGKPITDREFNIWLGDRGNVLRNTDSNGEIKMYIADVTPRTIRVLPDFRFDCRSKQDFGRGDRIEYSLDEILSRGVVSQNLCGSAESRLYPGVLIIFVRPRTFMEKWRL